MSTFFLRYHRCHKCNQVSYNSEGTSKHTVFWSKMTRDPQRVNNSLIDSLCFSYGHRAHFRMKSFESWVLQTLQQVHTQHHHLLADGSNESSTCCLRHGEREVRRKGEEVEGTVIKAQIGYSSAVLDTRGTLCVISLEAHMKSIQGVIGMSEQVTSQTRKL